MTTFLLDVNVLIALMASAHIQHVEAHDGFTRTGKRSFATCPITENGLLRIVGNPKYPSSPGPPSLRANGGRLASMDHRLAVDAVPGGNKALQLI